MTVTLFDNINEAPNVGGVTNAGRDAMFIHTGRTKSNAKVLAREGRALAEPFMGVFGQM